MGRVLVACEFSGVVRDAFASAGHDAWSCDLLESERAGQHFRCDVREVLGLGWDLMIAHPPCTSLAVSGARHFKHKVDEQAVGLAFVEMLFNAPVGRVAIENPVSVISTRFRGPDQVLQPFQFGDDASKRTCLWLHNLWPLVPTEILRRAPGHRWSNQTASGQNRLSPGPERWRERSRTYPGIAAAMAVQWGAFL